MTGSSLLVVVGLSLLAGVFIGKILSRKVTPKTHPSIQRFGGLEVQTIVEWIFMNVPVTIWTVDTELKITDSYAPLIEKRTGTTIDVLRGKTLFDIFQTEDREHTGVVAHLKALGGEEISYEVEWAGRWFVARVHPWYSEDGKLKGCIGIAFDVADMKSKEEKLHHLSSELGRAQSDLQRFAYAVSHDLKEPIRMISGYLELLGKKCSAELSSEARDYINTSISSAKRLHHLVDSLLNFCRAGNASLSLETCDLNLMLSEVGADYASSFASREGRLELKPLPTVHADVTLLPQVFRNLLSNALKFHRGIPPVIVIDSRVSPNGYILSISDNGIGIEAQYLDKIFVPLTRLHTRDEFEGDGIGLSLCSRIMERHGGKIWVESVPGQGTTFFLLFPNPETRIEPTLSPKVSEAGQGREPNASLRDT